MGRIITRTSPPVKLRSSASDARSGVQPKRRLVRNSDQDREAVGKCLERAYRAMGWDLNEFAQHVPRDEEDLDTPDAPDVGVDPRIVGRWVRGLRPVPIHRFVSMTDFYAKLVLELSDLSPHLCRRQTVEYVHQDRTARTR
jgi:hypothetical protein